MQSASARIWTRVTVSITPRAPLTVLFLTIQFSISHLFLLSFNVKNCIWPIDRTISGATTPGQRGFGSDGNEGILHIPQTSNFTVASPSDCLGSYPGHSLVRVSAFYRDTVGVFYNPADCSTLGESYPSAEMQSLYSATPADWATLGESYPVCRDAVDIFWSPVRLGSVGKVLPLYRHAVGIFCNPKTTGQRWESLTPSTEIQSVYSEAHVQAHVLDWEIVVSKFELQSTHCTHFRSNTLGQSMNLLIPPATD